MGGLLRCDGCGSIRWDVLNLTSGSAPECPTCGEQLKPERRRPGRRASSRRFSSRTAAERRDVTAPPVA